VYNIHTSLSRFTKLFTRTQKEDSPKEIQLTEEINPELASMVDRFVSRWHAGEVAIKSTEIVSSLSKQHLRYELCSLPLGRVTIWKPKCSEVRILFGGLAVIVIDDVARRINKDTDPLKIAWDSSVTSHPTRFNELAERVQELLDKTSTPVEVIMHARTTPRCYPNTDKLKQAVAEFLDKAPGISTANFDENPKQFLLAGTGTYVIIARCITNAYPGLYFGIYANSYAIPLARFIYTALDGISDLMFYGPRFTPDGIAELFDFNKYPVEYCSTGDEDKRHLDSACWAELFKGLLETTADKFAGGQTLWQNAVGVIGYKEVRTCGYIRKVGDADYLELTIRYEGKESHQADGKVILHYCIGYNKVTRLDQNNNPLLALGAYHVGNYLNHAPVVEKEKEAGFGDVIHTDDLAQARDRIQVLERMLEPLGVSKKTTDELRAMLRD